MHDSAAHPSVVLLVNPTAGRGRALARADAIERALRAVGSVERHDTRGRGDETRIALDAAVRGAGALAVVGGDGSVSHAARGLLAAPRPIPLAIFGAGTGNDFAKSLDAPVHDIAAMTARIAAGRTRSVDVGYVDGVPFLNAAGFGFDVDVLERLRTPTMLRGTAAYVLTALRALRGYRGLTARLCDVGDSVPAAARDDSTPAPPARRLLLVFANGRYFGGAFHIAPHALLDNGALDLVMIDDASTLRRLSLFAKALRGAHLHESGVHHARGGSFLVDFAQPPVFEADGELHQARASRVEVRVQPRALLVVT